MMTTYRWFLVLGLGLVACSPSGGGRVAVPPCQNGVQDGTETGVDCGGTCGACPGTACTAPAECASKSCVANACAAPTCSDGIKNGTELQVDCGGTCGACAVATCSNGVKDGNETGVDCGGPCKACEVTDACTNGRQDAGEEGVDCGGSCTPCGAEPTCSDNVQNQDETDKDCGGTKCPKCGSGKKCEGGGDCTTGVCSDDICGEAGPTCTNGEQDAGETDKDCGGPCGACATGKTCGDHDDCLSATCIFGVCRDPSCSDDLLNQGESDVDCGGNHCSDCEDKKKCGGNGDCQSQVCEAGTCVSCSDGVQNQDESDRDCGGDKCDKCPNDKKCGDIGDCVSNTCINGVCKPEGSSAGFCEIEADCNEGYFCEYLWNEEPGADADWKYECLAERDGAQPFTACEAYEDCAGFGCFNGFCTEACGSDSDCRGGGRVCASEQNYFDGDGDEQADITLTFEYCLGFDAPGGACLSEADCPTGKRCTVYLEENLSGGSLDPDGGFKAVGRCEAELAGQKADGAQCEMDRECKNGLCTPQGLCSKYCKKSSECEPLAIPGTGTLTAVCSAFGRWAGDDIADRTGFVYVSACFATAATDSLTPCGPSAATPYRCEAVDEICRATAQAWGPDIKATAEYACRTKPGANILGDACSEAADCESGYCLPDGSGGGYCSAVCDPSVGCTSGLACTQEGLIERKGKYASNGVNVPLCTQ